LFKDRHKFNLIPQKTGGLSQKPKAFFILSASGIQPLPFTTWSALMNNWRSREFFN
jgi:hypothetical protein